MHTIKISGKQVKAWPALDIFVQKFSVQFSTNTDESVLNINEDATMADVWEDLTPEDREEFCRRLGETKKYENIHQGLLALLPIGEVLDLACMFAFQRIDEIVQETLKNRNHELLANLLDSNALLHRLMKVKGP